jgi:uncharacterized protein (DUF2236 family)
MTKSKQPTDFYFSPQGKVHQLHRERLLILFGGQRALLMQLAHPLVAQGVLDYSSVRKDPLGRLNRTLQLTQSFIFGTNDDVDQAAEKINRVHRAVKGNLNHTIGVHDVGTSYHALNPELLTWVWATLADTAVLVYETFINSLSDDEKESYYQEFKKLLPPLGGEIEKTPATFKDLAPYLQQMYKSKKVAVGEEAKREILPYLLLQKPKRLKLPLLPLSVPLVKITVGLLPVELREQYNLSWSEVDQIVFDTFAAASRKLHTSKLAKLIPDNIRFTTYYRRSLRKQHTSKS